MGDLNGVTQKLDYIHQLGFDGIWLMPIFQSPSYHKYNTTDYYKIDPDYGTAADLKQLVSRAHELGIKVIIDLALNHSATDNINFLKACAAEAQQRGELKDSEKQYLEGLSTDQISALAQMYSFADTSRNGYTQVPGHSFFYESNFSSTMPEFNFDSPLAQDLFRSVIHYWMDEANAGVDGYRLDAVSYYYMNNTSANTAALNRIQSYGQEVDPDCYFVGECWQNSPIITQYYSDSTLNSYFWFPAQGANGFVSEGMYDKGKYLRGEKAMLEAAGSDIAAPFLDNHDTARMTFSALDMAKFQYGLLATLSGNVFTYYGDECGIGQGQSNNDESKRTHMPWGDGQECQDPANAAESYYPHGDVKTQLADPNSLVNFVAAANRLRNAYPALGWGQIDGNEFEEDDETSLLAIDKSLDGEKVRVVYNFSRVEAADYQAAAGEKLVGQLCSKGAVQETDGKYSIPAYSIALFQK